MAVTYEAIATQTLGSDAASVTFSSISNTYTDIVLVANYKVQNNGYMLGFRVGNGSIDAGTNYSWTRVLGYSGGTYSGRNSNMTLGAGMTGGSNSNNMTIFHFQNYSNTSTYKTILTRSAVNATWVEADVNLWRSTSAINAISFAESGDGGSGTFGTGNILSGSSFTLYGIKAA